MKAAHVIGSPLIHGDTVRVQIIYTLSLETLELIEVSTIFVLSSSCP